MSVPSKDEMLSTLDYRAEAAADYAKKNKEAPASNLAPFVAGEGNSSIKRFSVKSRLLRKDHKLAWQAQVS